MISYSLQISSYYVRNGNDGTPMMGHSHSPRVINNISLSQHHST